MLLFGVFFLFEGSLYFSFILFEGEGVCFGGWGVVSFFVFVCVFFIFAVSIAISF